jgi:hypothetical protein
LFLRLDGMADLIDIVRRVLFLRGTAAASRNTQAVMVQEKLHDGEIYTVRDFIECSQLINRRLLRREHKALHFTMMELLLRAACDDIFGEGGPGAEASVEALMEQAATDNEDVSLPDELPDEQVEAVEEIGRLVGGVQVGLDWQCTGRGNAVEGGVYALQADV